jgi:preprotein translocase subunit Sec61beta
MVGRSGSAFLISFFGGESMGANPTQAVAIALFLIAFVLLAGAFAGGGILYVLGFLVLLGISIAMFLKVKPLEHGKE